MTRLAGNPGVWRYLRYAAGFRLPAENLDWVWHDLTDAGWRTRMLVRHLVVMLPVCVVLSLLPGEWWIRLTVPLLALITSTFVVLISTDELRNSRLHQHGLPKSRQAQNRREV